jgi:DHA1 family tetracycline resistance protein-like MFS transporter
MEMQTSAPERPTSTLPLASVVFLDALSYALILPLLPFILKDHGAGAIAGGLLVACHAAMAAISGPLMGSLSDRLGRKMVIVGSLLGTILAYVGFGLTGSLVGLFASRIFAGAMAGNIGVVQAAVADGSSDADRGKAMAMLTAAWALGFVVGPAIGVVLPPNAQVAFWPGMIAAAACGVALLGVAASYRPANKAGGVTPQGTAVGTGLPPGQSWSKVELIALFGVVGMSQTGLVAMTGFWASSAFQWGAREVSLLFLWVSLIVVVVQIFGMGRLIKSLGENKSLLVGVGLTLAACVLLLVQPRSRAVLLVSAPLLLCGITITQTLCSALLSKVAAETSRGAVLGLANGVTALGRVAGPALCGLLFTYVDPTGPYWLVAAMMGGWILWLGARQAQLQRAPQAS